MAGLMTVGEVADYLRVTEKTLYRLLKRGDIPASRVGRGWRFDRAVVDAWLRRNSSRKRARILVVDDEDVIRALFRDVLESLGHEVVTAGTGAEGLALVQQQDFALVFLDLKMPGMDGAELFGRIKAIRPDLAVTIITGYPASEMMARALEQGPFGVMSKPFGVADIIVAVNNFLRLSGGGASA